MLYELIGYNTDMRYQQDVRYRDYTTSEKKAAIFRKIPKIQFTDSGHGIVFCARETIKRKPKITILADYVCEHMRPNAKVRG